MSKPEYASYIALVEEQDINDELPKQHLLFGTFEIQSDLLNISLNDSIKLNMSKLKNEVLSYTEYKFINEIYLIKNNLSHILSSFCPYHALLLLYSRINSYWILCIIY